MLLLIKLYTVVLSVKSVNEILQCNHSNESYRAVLFTGVITVSML